MAGAWRIRSWPTSAATACRPTTVPTDVEVTALARQDRERSSKGKGSKNTIPILRPALNGYPIRFYDPTTRECEIAAAIGGMKSSEMF
eukprot:1809982-Amphidinium_carterae.1